MSKPSKEIQQEIDHLVNRLNHHCYQYYVLDSPEISDSEYDGLYRKLKQLEDSSGHLLPESPTQRVGAPPLEKFKKVKHTEPMLSLDNAFSYDEILEFDQRVRKLLKTENEVGYTVEPKYDGFAVELNYINGILNKASTRGDGNVGEDVTQNIRTIKAVPLKIGGTVIPEEIDIRGEVYMNIDEFKALNTEREQSGELNFANPRNAASGTVRQLDPSVVAQRKLHLACYGLGVVKGMEFKSQRDFVEWLKNAHFPVSLNMKYTKTFNEVIDAIKEIEEQRSNFPFEADGAVIKVDDFSLQKNLGVKTREPRWAIAFKFPAHQGITRINEIIASVGRTGTITPVASLEPVSIGGVTVSRSTLHNWDEIERKDIRIGDTVVVERAGDVIPHVLSVVEEKRTGNEKHFSPPVKCPDCGSSVEKEEGSVAFRCIGLNCKAQAQENIKHYASRSAMDIEGLGEKNVELLFSQGLINHFIDIYKITREDLLSLPRFAEKSAQNLLNAIHNSKTTTLAKFIYSLGIVHVGEYASKMLAKNLQALEDLYNITEEQIVTIKQMGEKTAKSVSRFFNDEKNLDVLKELNSHGLKISNPDFEGAGLRERPFDGLTFVITGTLTVPRQEVEGLIEKNGGHVAKSVSKKTGYVVLGESPGSKLKKAQSLGVKTISYEEFIQMVKEGPQG